MGLGFYTPLLNMSRGFLFAQSLRLIIVYTTLQMNLAQFPVFHLRSIKHPQPNRDSPAWTLFHASLDLLLLPAQNEHMGDRPFCSFFLTSFPFLIWGLFLLRTNKKVPVMRISLPTLFYRVIWWLFSVTISLLVFVTLKNHQTSP